MPQDRFHRTTETGKTKLILLTLPTGGWERLDALHSAAQQKVPGITHDMIVSAWVVVMLQQQPETPPVETEQAKLEESNPS